MQSKSSAGTGLSNGRKSADLPANRSTPTRCRTGSTQQGYRAPAALRRLKESEANRSQETPCVCLETVTDFPERGLSAFKIRHKPTVLQRFGSSGVGGNSGLHKL
ncbi:hypothetical protein XENOCAPTIV_020102 [Xenoophorus captivus]|uniref:Uncharacterized protein n=1 Tax=Xenoophorus captivus TaxID=1517983 RepID=A0ABV0SG86_9TELE